MKTMNCRVTDLLCVVSVVVAASALKCTSPQESADGDISVVDNKVCGVLYEPDGKPASDARVTMRSNDYLPEINRLGKRRADDGFFVCSTATDHQGQYRFTTADSIPEGTYCIEGRDDDNNCILIQDIIIDSVLLNGDTWLEIDSPLIKTDNTLRPPGAINGTVQPVGDSIYGSVFVYGLDNYAVIDHDGSFVLENMPSGNHQLQIVYTVQNGSMQKSELEVTTRSGDTATIDTLYGVFFSGNGNTGGTIPADNRLYHNGDTVVIPGNSGKLVKAGYTFAGWNTAADGSGVTRVPGETVIIDGAAIVLYVQWAVKRFSLTVASYGKGTATGSDSVVPGAAHPITATADAGYAFEAWTVIHGTATIADSTAAATTVTLENGDAEVAGIFKEAATFQKTFGGTSSEAGHDISQTADGGYIIAAFTESFGAGWNDAYLIKTKANGDTAWTKTFGGTGQDYVSSVRQTSDGGYTVAGSITSSKTDNDVFLIKTTYNGDTLWSKTFGAYDLVYSVQPIIDGGFIIVGVSFSLGGTYLIKTTADGDTMWSKTFSGTYFDSISSVRQTADGGYIIVGESGNGVAGGGEAGILLIKTTALGDTVWTREFDIGTGWDYGNSVQQTDDEGYIITGSTQSLGSFEAGDIYLLKINADGDSIWTTTFGGTQDEVANSVCQTDDGGYIITGFTGSFGAGNSDVYLIKTTGDGDTVWTKTFGGSGNDIGFSVRQTTDGGYCITGQTDSFGAGATDVLLIKTDGNGNVE